MPRSRDPILLLLPSLTALGGGIELYLRQFLEALALVRPEAPLIAVLARESCLARPDLLSPELRARLEIVGVASERRSLRIGEFVARALWQAIARWRPALVVCGHVNYATISRTVATICRTPMLALTYGIEAWNVTLPLTIRALRAADTVIAISSFTGNAVIRSMGIAAERVSILHNAVDVERFTPGVPSPAVATKLHALPRPRLLTVCRLDAAEQYKGVDTVIRALARHRDLRASYLVVGDGTDRPRLEALAAKLAVSVTFFGRATDEELPDLYRACDLFVMPSRNEGFGYVFIEAMACGIPVVAGNADGSVDALADGVLGVLVDPTDPDAVARAIRAQLSLTTPAAMREAAPLHAAMVARFSPASFAANLSKALERL
jgi:phosphatidyl-myo-inositol dimannoside synthase